MELVRPPSARSARSRAAPEPSAPPMAMEESNSSAPYQRLAAGSDIASSSQSQSEPRRSVSSSLPSAPGGVQSLAASVERLSLEQPTASQAAADNTLSSSPSVSSSSSILSPSIPLYYLNVRFPSIPFVLHRVTQTSDLTDLSVYYSTSTSLIRRYNRRCVFDYLDHMLGEDLFIPVSLDFLKENLAKGIQFEEKSIVDHEMEEKRKQQALVQRFQWSAPSARIEDAQYYLEDNEWNLETAMDRYFQDVEWEQKQRGINAPIKRRPITQTMMEDINSSNVTNSTPDYSSQSSSAGPSLAAIRASVPSAAGLRKQAEDRQHRLQSLVKESEQYWKQRNEEEMAEKRRATTMKFLHQQRQAGSESDQELDNGKAKYVLDQVGAFPVVYLQPNKDGFFGVVRYQDDNHAVEMQPMRDSMEQPLLGERRPSGSNSSALESAGNAVRDALASCLPGSEAAEKEKQQAKEAEGRMIQQALLVSNSRLI